MARTAIDMTGKQINWLTVLDKVEMPSGTSGGARWRCKCKCGKEKIIRGVDLRSGRVYSCGCYNIQINKEKHPYENLLNQKFNKLTVIEDTFKTDNNRHHIWKCYCECGRYCEVSADKLKSGNTQSCGCLQSKGELQIQNLLEELNIPFEKQKTFQDCRFPDTNALAKFDFFVNNEYIIEYDGIQHFIATGYTWNTNENLIKTKEHDEYKNNWCKTHNIPIIRIPYTKKNITKEDILLSSHKGESYDALL